MVLSPSKMDLLHIPLDLHGTLLQFNAEAFNSFLRTLETLPPPDSLLTKMLTGKRGPIFPRSPVYQSHGKMQKDC